jgi:hypothetical protein
MWLMQNGLANPDNAGAASTPYLHLFGLTGLAYMWALMAKAALAGGSVDPFLRPSWSPAAASSNASCPTPAGCSPRPRPARRP